MKTRLQQFGGWILRVLIAFDQFVQACCNFGIIGITISARAGTAKKRGHKWGCILCKFLDWFEKDHCALAIKGDIKRAKVVIEHLSKDDWDA